MLKSKMNISGVLFMDRQKWFDGSKMCFGVRFNFDMLPKGSVVVGFTVLGPSDRLTQTLIEPAMSRDQIECFDWCLSYIEDVMKDGFDPERDKYLRGSMML
jgi:hypothetical protein